MQAGKILIGIGGWVFEPWRGTFYPNGLGKSQELAYASRQFTTIEINATFYRTQSRKTFERWAAETPDDFVFSVKANRLSVNRKNLADGYEAITRFVTSGITALEAKLGPILWQMPAFKRFNANEIDGFFSALPKEQDGIRLRHVFEPRHKSFVCPQFIDIARKHNVATCLALADDYPMIADPTADFCYLRLQTTSAAQEAGHDIETIAGWVERLKDLAEGNAAGGLPLLGGVPDKRPRDCFVYMIAGAKERNPAAARAFLTAIEAVQR